MVELLALAFTQLSRTLWARAIVGKVLAVILWGAYGISLPKALSWADESLPLAVNLSLPFVGILAATAMGVRHYLHHRHRSHEDHSPPSQPA